MVKYQSRAIKIWLQPKYVGRGTCLEWLPPPKKSSASLGNNKGGWVALGDQWHGMVSCKSHTSAGQSGVGNNR